MSCMSAANRSRSSRAGVNRSSSPMRRAYSATRSACPAVYRSFASSARTSICTVSSFAAFTSRYDANVSRATRIGDDEQHDDGGADVEVQTAEADPHERERNRLHERRPESLRELAHRPAFLDDVRRREQRPVHEHEGDRRGHRGEQRGRHLGRGPVRHRAVHERRRAVREREHAGVEGDPAAASGAGGSAGTARSTRRRAAGRAANRRDRTRRSRPCRS